MLLENNNFQFLSKNRTVIYNLSSIYELTWESSEFESSFLAPPSPGGVAGVKYVGASSC